ncbi:MAG TPA: ABC transporter substrate-binding protein [Nocardioidaceae bacterium]|jgi:peptide/nickel transport system substrate-binding protein|nr:ABC transporter substrate-binding protein [Nocardioidaceae bacterium]
MTRKRWRALAVLGTVAALGLSACGGGGSSNNSNNGGSGAPEKFNAALSAVANPSDKKGGIVKLGQSGDWADTVDPGETYYGYSWDFLRTYARTLVMFKSAPGKAGLELTPDLAENLGKPSNGGKTWTYKIRKGVKFEDGTEVHAQDVKYAVLRSTDKDVFPRGPAYFDAMLNLPAGYKGPYKTPKVNTDSAISTPDNYTVVFHLKAPFAGFDYLAQLPQTAPVPQKKDTGAKYKQHVVSSGPYMWDKYEAGKLYTLKRNKYWDQKTDPNRKALPDGYSVQLNMNPDDVDNQVIAGDLDADVQGTGVQPAALSRVLTDPKLKARADNPNLARLWYTDIMPTVKPFDNIECRKAVFYGMDRTGYQTAYGGPFAGGDLATTILPPLIPGYQKFDLFPAGKDSKGDPTAAKDALKKCGKPNGFSTSIGYRAERPKEKATAEAFQQALDKVGIKLTIKPLPEGTYTSETCGLPSYVVKNDLGLCVYGWGADWPDGYGFLSQIVDSRTMRPGASNLNVKIPQVDKMLDQATTELDNGKRNEMWGAIDKRVMQEALIYPGVYAKSLLLRPKNATNVFVNESFGMYDYLAMGAKK